MSKQVSLPYWHVDAFATRLGSGNPAGVVLLEGHESEAQLARFASELCLPATAFVWPAREPGLFPVRWLSPHGEIALCGHGSLAAGHVLLGREGADAVRLASPGGEVLEVRLRQGKGTCELALPALPSEARDIPGLGDMLGALPLETRWNAAGYALAVFATAEEVRALTPDLAVLGALGNWQVTATAPGLPATVPDLDDSREDVVSRVFRRGGEDAATGSAHALLAPYWCARLDRQEFTGWQASARGARITCRLDGERVWLGGGCVTVVEGRCYLEG